MGEIPSAAGWRPSASVRAAAVVFAITLATAAGVDRLVSAAMRNEERVEAAGRLAPYAHSLSLVVDRRTAVLLGLKAFVEVRWGEPSFEDDFNAFAAAAESATPGIRALQYVEGAWSAGPGRARGTRPSSVSTSTGTTTRTCRATSASPSSPASWC